LVETLTAPEDLKNVMEIMSVLGLNTLQLTLISSLGCALQLKEFNQLFHLIPRPNGVDPLSDSDLEKIVFIGKALGVEVIPEISITTRATGWYHAGFLVECPRTFCESGEIANDIT